ncbi:hypothetical protein C1M53_22875 [Mesorhizobium sp. Pch-S]|nr:hypothetical protein C1M53_22875 [Mesorhizobium sp. Pch-S]
MPSLFHERIAHDKRLRLRMPRKSAQRFCDHNMREIKDLMCKEPISKLATCIRRRIAPWEQQPYSPDRNSRS